jgi:hypothetical protein
LETEGKVELLRGLFLRWKKKRKKKETIHAIVRYIQITTTYRHPTITSLKHCEHQNTWAGLADRPFPSARTNRGSHPIYRGVAGQQGWVAKWKESAAQRSSPWVVVLLQHENRTTTRSKGCAIGGANRGQVHADESL